MEKRVYNIGKLRYMLTLLTGRHRQIIKETIEKKDINGDVSSESHNCDYIITIGRSAVILTEAAPRNPNMRLPYVVKRWKYMGTDFTPEHNRKLKLYIDNEGYKWAYIKDSMGEIISITKDSKEFYHFELRFR